MAQRGGRFELLGLKGTLEVCGGLGASSGGWGCLLSAVC